mgnify:CR=1 FL=1
MEKEVLLLRPDDIPRYTNISGNLDLNRITPHIRNSQRTYIKRVLGKSLYEKILNDFENDTLEGDYENIYEDFVLDMLVNYSAYLIVLFNGLRVENAGNVYNDPDNSTSADMEDVEKIANRYLSLASAVELEFNNWIKNNKITEYPNSGSCKTVTTYSLPWVL